MQENGGEGFSNSKRNCCDDVGALRGIYDMHVRRSDLLHMHTMRCAVDVT